MFHYFDTSGGLIDFTDAYLLFRRSFRVIHIITSRLGTFKHPDPPNPMTWPPSKSPPDPPTGFWQRLLNMTSELACTNWPMKILKVTRVSATTTLLYIYIHIYIFDFAMFDGFTHFLCFSASVLVFSLPEPQVVILDPLKILSRGDVVFAVYPDTTSFYQATVVQAPRKVSGGGSFAMVHFIDDSDEHGVTHDKAVLMNHVMRPPYGVTLQ
jgi:hypothetical protein